MSCTCRNSEILVLREFIDNCIVQMIKKHNVNAVKNLLDKHISLRIVKKAYIMRFLIYSCIHFFYEKFIYFMELKFICMMLTLDY